MIAGTGEREELVDNGPFQLAPWRKAGSWILARSGRLLAGAGLAALSPRVASAARKDDRREDDQNANDRDDQRDQQDHGSNNQRDKEDHGSNNQSEQRRDGEQSHQDANRDSGTRSERQDSEDDSTKHERRDDRESNQDDVRGESAGNGNQRVARRQEAEADGTNDGNGSNGDGDNTRRTRELEQRRPRDDEPADEPPAEEPTTPAPVVPTNPNVPADTPTGIPELTDAELIVQGNEDVIASVSTSGGFAFARSGNVIAISGPDGAQIIQSDEPVADADVAPPPTPDEPSPDGGNNDMDFTS